MYICICGGLCFVATYRRLVFFFFFFKQKTAYEMRISDWSSDVCSSDLFRRQWKQAGEAAEIAVGQIISHRDLEKPGFGCGRGGNLEMRRIIGKQRRISCEDRADLGFGEVRPFPGGYPRDRCARAFRRRMGKCDARAEIKAIDRKSTRLNSSV